MLTGPGRSRLIVVGAAALVLGLIVLFPARVVYQWFAPPEIRMAGLAGSIWNGGAAEGAAGGVYFRNLDWTLKPLAIFTGRVAFDAEFELAGGFAEAELGVTPAGRVSIRHLNASLPITALPLAGFGQSLRLDGTRGEVTLQLPRAEFDAGWPSHLSGTVAVSGLRVPVLSSTPLGTFRAEFRTDDEAIVGSVEDVSGVLDLAATITLTRDRSYSFVGQVGTGAGAPDSVEQQLRYLGSPNERGLRQFRIEGAL